MLDSKFLDDRWWKSPRSERSSKDVGQLCIEPSDTHLLNFEVALKNGLSLLLLRFQF